MKTKHFAIVIAAMLSGVPVLACTNIIVGRKASSDGSTMVSYNMDSYGMCDKLTVTPGGRHSVSEKVRVYDYDNLVHMGEIPQVPFTYRVVGSINEKQLSITETTWGGRTGQANPDGLLHYTSLMALALQRSADAREAIRTMTGLVAEYGYASSGETFSIVDPEEAWIMEMIGKGTDEKGAVWVAVRIPDDCICAHANQSRIHTFAQDDPENVVFSSDVISYARRKGYFSGDDADFDFSKAYSPTDFHMQRACEARVWSIFNRFSSDFGKYLETVDGFHIGSSEEMPLYIKPDRKLALKDVMDMMRDHYEGTPLDMTVDIAGGPWNSPYRPRPQEYSIDGMTYFFERPIATQQSACTRVCQMRGNLPDAVGGVLWYGNDDAGMVTYTPVYCCAEKSPECYNDPAASDVDFSWDSAFWVCNWVSNMVYQRYSLFYPKLKELRDELQDKYIAMQGEVDSKAAAMGSRAARKYLTSFGEECAAEMLSRWKELGIHLVVMYNDMALKPEKDGQFLVSPEGRGASPLRNGYNDTYRRAIASVTGNRHYSGEMTFVQISDPQIGFMDDSERFCVSEALLNAAVDSINAIRPAFVIVTGDLLHNYLDAAQRAIYESGMARIDPGIPVFITPGNHDIPGFNAEKLAGYLDFVGYDRFSFRKGDCALIGFDSCRIKEGSAEAEEEQFNWLCARMEQAGDCRHIFLFCHCPLVREDMEEPLSYENFPVHLREKYISAFKKYGVEALFTGHTHTGGANEIEGIKMINCGPVAHAFNNLPSGINVVKVSRDGFTATFLPTMK